MERQGNNGDCACGPWRRISCADLRKGHARLHRIITCAEGRRLAPGAAILSGTVSAGYTTMGIPSSEHHEGDVKWPDVKDFDLLNMYKGWKPLVVAIWAQDIR